MNPRLIVVAFLGIVVALVAGAGVLALYLVWNVDRDMAGEGRECPL